MYRQLNLLVCFTLLVALRHSSTGYRLTNLAQRSPQLPASSGSRSPLTDDASNGIGEADDGRRRDVTDDRIVEQYVDRQLGEMEERIGRRIDEQSRKLNQSVAIQYLEKVLDYVSEETQLNRELLMAKRDDRQRQIEQLQADVEGQRQALDRWSLTVADLEAAVGNLTHRLDGHLDDVDELHRAQKGAEHGGAESASTPTKLFAIDCEEAYAQDAMLHVRGFQYPTIEPRETRDPFKAACYVTDNTSWTVIQRRLDGSVDFYRNWSDYKVGFGQVEGEFWLGNERMHKLTNQGDYRLRVEMVTWDDKPHWAEYRHFRIGPESDKYRLNVAGFVSGGDAGDSLTSAWENDHNGQPFSTYDSDNDARFYDNCAQHYRGAWWFRSCFQSHLNGVYYQRGAHSNFFVRNGIQWNTIHPHSSLRHVVMKVRRNDVSDGDVDLDGDVGALDSNSAATAAAIVDPQEGELSNGVE